MLHRYRYQDSSGDSSHTIQVYIIGQAKRAPTLDCSIEISCDIYMYVSMSVCLWENHTKNTYAKMRGQNYMTQTRTYSKSVLGGKTDL